jgi:hypothetical protein
MVQIKGYRADRKKNCFRCLRKSLPVTTGPLAEVPPTPCLCCILRYIPFKPVSISSEKTLEYVTAFSMTNDGPSRLRRPSRV